jgi:hypothetical protein
VRGIAVKKDGKATETVNFTSGELVLHVTADGKTTSARVYIQNSDTGKEVDRDRLGKGGGHYANPETFHLPPGSYDIKIKPLEKEISEFWKQNVMVTAGERTQTTVDITKQNR